MDIVIPPPGPERDGPAPGFNVYGYLTSNLGLGVAGRNTVGTLLARGVPVRLVDVDPGGGMQGRDRSLADVIEQTRMAGPHRVNIFHVNPDQLLYLLDPVTQRVPMQDTLQVCVPFWELPRLPRSWIPVLRAMDVVLAPSLFVRDAILADLPEAQVLHYPQAVRIPDGISADRAAFGLPPDATVFVSSFDMRSDLERKNPLGAIDAFLRAFRERDDVRLVIKANNVDTVAGYSAHLERLRAAASDPRLLVLHEQMGYREILTLYASCDVLVSLHRAEGLGLSLLESMALGMPVVATAWSGNMDFMTAENSCPVGYGMTPVVPSTQAAYREDTSGEQVWAEPDLDEAARWMRSLADDPVLRASIGQRARADAARILAEYDLGAVFDELAQMSPLDAEHRALRQLRAAFPYHYGRRIARALWRRAKMAVTGRL